MDDEPVLDLIPRPIQACNTIGGLAVNAEQQAAQQREWMLRHSVETLQAAARIRADDKLMSELRQFIRQQRDELGLVLDTIG
jgi:hypothetical protein